MPPKRLNYRMNDRNRVLMAERWLKFFSRCDPWPEDEMRRAVLAERRLIDAARAQHHRRGMQSLSYAGRHLVSLGLLTSRDAEQWLAYDM